MKKVILDFDDKEIHKKSVEIGQVIDNMSLPMVLCVIGTVIVEIFNNARLQGVDVKDVLCKWLLDLAETIMGMNNVDDGVVN